MPPSARCAALPGPAIWTFAGSDIGGHRAAAVDTLIETCKLNDVDPQAWLADVLAKPPDHPAKRIDELLPWRWTARRTQMKLPPLIAFRDFTAPRLWSWPA